MMLFAGGQVMLVDDAALRHRAVGKRIVAHRSPLIYTNLQQLLIQPTNQSPVPDQRSHHVETNLSESEPSVVKHAMDIPPAW